MKITVEKNDLLNLIGKTQNIIEKKNTMAILMNILLEAGDNHLKVYATDLEVSLTDEIKAQVIEPGKVAIGAKSLFEIAKELSDGPIQLIKKENNWLEIKQGKYTSKIVGVNTENYPIFPTNHINNFLTLKANILKDMIDKTIFIISMDNTRYFLNGVFFEINPKKNFKMVATDGHRLCSVDKKIEEWENITNSLGVIIPRKGINEIKKLLEGLTDNIQISVEGSQFILKHDSTLLMIRLIEGKYPNYQQFIPPKLEKKAIINREAILTSLKRVSLLANQKSKVVVLNLTKGKLEISSSNPDLGDAKEEIDIDYEGSPLKIGFNAKFMSEVLGSITEDTIDFEINDNLSPGIIRPHDDTNHVCVIMPMRI